MFMEINNTKHCKNLLSFDHGFIVLKIENLNDFLMLLKENNNFKGFLFRGQEFESYKLEPTIIRSYKVYKCDFNNYNDYLNEYKNYVERQYKSFISSLRGRIDDKYNLEKDRFEIWALGRSRSTFRAQYSIA